MPGLSVNALLVAYANDAFAAHWNHIEVWPVGVRLTTQYIYVQDLEFRSDLLQRPLGWMRVAVALPGARTDLLSLIGDVLCVTPTAAAETTHGDVPCVAETVPATIHGEVP